MTSSADGTAASVHNKSNDGLPLLIGLNGFKGVGKDTIGNIMVENWEFKRIAFADKLKQAFAILWDIHAPVLDSWKQDPNMEVWLVDNEFRLCRVVKHFSVRQALQRMGTEVGREFFGENFWVDQLLPYKEPYTAAADKRYHGNRVATDARFENELYRIRQLGGYNIRINRPGFEPDGHASEIEPPNWLIDKYLDNDGTLDELVGKIADVLTEIYHLDRSPA